MCVVCTASSTYNYQCVTETTNTAEITASSVEATFNTYGKTSYDYDVAAQQLVRGDYKWNDGTSGNAIGTAGEVTWSFAATPDAGYQTVTAAMMSFVLRAIDYIDDVANISFTRLGTGTSGAAAYSNAGEIRIQNDADYGGGWATWTSAEGTGGDPDEILSATVTLGGTAGYVQEDNYGMTVTLHEIMHALGILHPGDYNGPGATTYENQAVYFEDSRQFTVMSYWSEGKTGADFQEWITNPTTGAFMSVGGYSTNLMLHDIAALQLLYGANTTTRTGDTIYGFNSNTGDAGWTLSDQYDSIIAAVWDAGGIDTLDLSGFTTSSDVDLREEAFSSFGRLKNNFSIARGVVIENAIGGSADDTLLGNAADNRLTGNAGNDKLYGEAGNDWLDGGAGTDWLFGGDGDDTIVYDAADDWAGGNVQGGAGFDTLLFNMVRQAVDLLAYGFEQAALRLVDMASQLWSEMTEFWSLDNQMTRTDTIWDNGTSTVIVYDVYGTEDWSQWTREYSVTGVLTGESYVYDPVAPLASADTATVVEDSGVAASGNLLTNDTGNGTLASIGATSVAVSGATVIAGAYGTLTVQADGSYSYALNNANASVNALSTGQSLTDSFVYAVANAYGTSTASLTVTIEGHTDGATINGTSGADTLTGSASAETINGGGGNDIIDGRGGGDRIDGGSGNDRIHYYASDNPALISGGAGTDTLVVTGDTLPTGFDLAARGFEFAEQIVTDAGSQIWATRTSLFDSSWNLLSRTTLNDNGLRIVEEYSGGQMTRQVSTDDGNILPYDSVTITYDSVGRLATRLQVNDNGTQTLNTYADGVIVTSKVTDPLDALHYKSMTSHFTNGALTSRVTVSDAGVETTTTFEDGVLTSNAMVDALNRTAYSSIAIEYSGGKIASKLQVNDNGTRITSEYADGVLSRVTSEDPLNRVGWTSQVDDYADGVRVRNTTVSDDTTVAVTDYANGAIAGRATTDPMNVKLWSSITDSYSEGRLATRLQINDDGTRVTTTFNGATVSTMQTADVDNAFAYDTITAVYSAGKVAERSVVNDNGVTIVTTFASTGLMALKVTTDVLDVASYETITDTYDAAGRLELRVQVLDNGNRTTIGGVQNNRLEGGAWNDAFLGGDGADTFVFGPGGGKDQILDFADGVDRFDLRAYGVDTVAELEAAATITQTSRGLVFDFGDDDILTVVNFTHAQLGNSDFVTA